MENLTLVIGNKLKNIRNSRNLSLDDVAELTGVSKAMLGQIERGKSNPTVSTLWKISTGLRVSFSSFIDESKEELKVINIDEIEPVIEEDSTMKLYPIFPFDPNRGVEIFTIELEKGCIHESSSHNSGVEEYIIVTEGEIEMTIGEENFILKKGCSIKFMADKNHTYKNLNEDKAVFQHIIFYRYIKNISLNT